MSALHTFCQEVVEDLESGQAVSHEAFGFPSIEVIIQLVTSIISAIRACRQPPVTPPVTPPVRPPVTPPAPVAAIEEEGTRLHDMAVRAWNENTAEYDGWEFKNAVRQALKTSAEHGHRSRKRDAVRTVTSLFNRARRATPEVLEAVAGEVA